LDVGIFYSMLGAAFRRIFPVVQGVSRFRRVETDLPDQKNVGNGYIITANVNQEILQTIVKQYF